MADSRRHHRRHQVVSGSPLRRRYGRQEPLHASAKAGRWSGVRDCTDWGHVAPQHINPNPSAYTKYVGWNNYRGGMSEDCLVVNVWTPALRDNGKRPVMFIIHGGGYHERFGQSGGFGRTTPGEAGQYGGSYGQPPAGHAGLCRSVGLWRRRTSQFRQCRDDGPGAWRSSGSATTSRSLAAIRRSVTITGQSGGGGKCSHLMAMPSARGLFHKVAIQSGSTLKTGRHEQRQKEAERSLHKAGGRKGRSRETAVGAIQGHRG